MALNAFIVRPFGTKTLQVPVTDAGRARLLDTLREAEAARAAAAAPPTTPSPHPPPTAAPAAEAHRGPSPVSRVGEVTGARLCELAVDFDAVQALLIDPALAELRIQGQTAAAVLVAGNIREDMFNRLITADLVIADLSYHNPNVYYELGIRQAFRDKYTFLIRCDLSDEPFDLKTDRYFAYALDELQDEHRRKAAVERLTTALRTTIASYEADSPVFKLLPDLQAEDRGRFIAVPDDFREEVERAQHHQRAEHLSLLAMECEGFLWEVEGLRLVGRAQFEANLIAGAKTTWEQILGRYPDDVEANTVLSTVYQRLADVRRSEQALARIAKMPLLPPGQVAELRSLAGRNHKEAWISRWMPVPPEIGPPPGPRQYSEAERLSMRRTALRSPLLQRAIDAYHEAFLADLNNAYAGLNALSLLVVQVELAEALPQLWLELQRCPADAERELALRRARIARLAAALSLAVESARERIGRRNPPDPWFLFLEAAVQCIVSSQPEHVAQLFEQARDFAPRNAEQAMRHALELYALLDIAGRRQPEPDVGIGTMRANVDASLRVLRADTQPPLRCATPQRVLVFVGLRVDDSAGFEPLEAEATATSPARLARERLFPPELEPAVREALDQAVAEECALGGVVLGVAAGASGGDILFHELCAQRRIATRLCLALPVAEHVGRYVAPAGPQWVERFAQVLYRVRSRAADARAAAQAQARPGWRMAAWWMA